MGSPVPIPELSRCSTCRQKLRLVDHRIGKREQPWWDFQVMQLGGLQIYDQARTWFDKTE
jgi:hypothetical protein